MVPHVCKFLTASRSSIPVCCRKGTRCIFVVTPEAILNEYLTLGPAGLRKSPKAASGTLFLLKPTMFTIEFKTPICGCDAAPKILFIF